MSAMLKITQIRSTIKRYENQKRTMRALGIKRIHQTVTHADSPTIRGMINAVSHLVKVEPVETEARTTEQPQAEAEPVTTSAESNDVERNIGAGEVEDEKQE